MVVDIGLNLIGGAVALAVRGERIVPAAPGLAGSATPGGRG